MNRTELKPIAVFSCQVKVLLENRNPESPLLESLESGRRPLYPETEKSPTYSTIEADIALLHVYFGQTTTTSGLTSEKANFWLRTPIPPCEGSGESSGWAGGGARHGLLLVQGLAVPTPGMDDRIFPPVRCRGR